MATVLDLDLVIAATAVIGPDGHIINCVDIRCSDENEARRLAKHAIDGHAVELWQLDRFVERFEPEH
jgi:hypothetical protein